MEDRVFDLMNEGGQGIDLFRDNRNAPMDLDPSGLLNKFIMSDKFQNMPDEYKKNVIDIADYAFEQKYTADALKDRYSLPEELTRERTRQEMEGGYSQGLYDLMDASAHEGGDIYSDDKLSEIRPSDLANYISLIENYAGEPYKVSEPGLDRAHYDFTSRQDSVINSVLNSLSEVMGGNR
tara:strand:- start:377 stop:916 length:540 start_codon:yes stop_codon:yes gene_type:complete